MFEYLGLMALGKTAFPTIPGRADGAGAGTGCAAGAPGPHCALRKSLHFIPLSVPAFFGRFVLRAAFPHRNGKPLRGVWKVKNTVGRPFEITLSTGGAAKASRRAGMTGTWKEEGDST